MSWSFTAIARTKEKLKAHSRKQLLAYHQEGTSGHALMSKVANHLDLLIDLFEPRPDGGLLRLETNGHIDGGQGNFRADLTTYCGQYLE